VTGRWLRVICSSDGDGLRCELMRIEWGGRLKEGEKREGEGMRSEEEEIEEENKIQGKRRIAVKLRI
jgi:hypothetical protein